jgi:hypothetical protein
MKRVFYLIMGIAFLFVACKKDDNPEAPILGLVSISTTDVQSFNNDVVVQLSYEDFQGDLGYTDADIPTLYVQDTRLSEPDGYPVFPVTPDMQELHVKGTFTVHLNSLFIMGSDTLETTTLQFTIKDRAGNSSNTVTSTPIQIHQ